MQSSYEISAEVSPRLNFPQQFQILVCRKSDKKSGMYFENTGETLRKIAV